MAHKKFIEKIDTYIQPRIDNNSYLAVIVLNISNYLSLLSVLPVTTCLEANNIIESRLSEILREKDSFFRLKPDEYGIFLPDMMNNSHITLALNKLTELFKLHISIDDKKWLLHPRLGVRVAESGGHYSAQYLVREAYAALYFAVTNHIQYKIYDVEFDKIQKAHDVLAFRLHDAIKNRELEVTIQPQISLETYDIIGGEVLSSWILDNKRVPADLFIALAEKMGLIKDITTWVVKNTFRMSRQLAEMGIDCKLSVNITASDLSDPSFTPSIAKLLELWKIPNNRILLEITENSLLDCSEDIKYRIAELEQEGIGLSIDDFGTGYSSLGYLKDLPVKQLKIDKSFIMGMLSNEKDITLVNAVIQLAHAFHLHVVAEGVEDYETLKQLRQFNCDCGQGYFISRPISFDEFVNFMKNDAAKIKASLSQKTEERRQRAGDRRKNER